MALDARRNGAYAAALEQAVGRHSVVLDLGAGTGVHGLMAARLGAKRVYLVESEDIIFVAQEIAGANGLGNVVRCLHGRIEELTLPEPVDVIVSVLTGNFLLTEDLLSSLFHARDTALRPGGVLIPSAATMEAAPVSAATLHEKEIASWSVAQRGVDLGRARRYAANTIFYRQDGTKDLALLAEPQPLHTVDFHRDDYSSVHLEVTYEIARSGTCHGWVGWFTMKLGSEWVSTSPYDAPMHWSPAFLPLDPPLTLEQGELVTFSLDRAPFGDWTWRVRAESASQQHSTLLSAPMSATTLEKATLDYAPSRSVDGEALMFVLSQCDGQRRVEEIAQRLSSVHPDRYANRAVALGFVQRVVKRYSQGP